MSIVPPRHVDPYKFTRVNELRIDGFTYRAIEKQTGVPHSTCWRWCNVGKET